MRKKRALLIALGGILVLWAAIASTACFNLSSVTGGGPDAGSSASDSGGSPPSSGSDSGAPFCKTVLASASPPTFCDDFDDEDGGPFATWNQPILSMGSVTPDSVLFFSRPNSLLAQTSALLTGAYAEADLPKVYGDDVGKGLSITMTFAMNVQSWDNSTSGQIIAAEVFFKSTSVQFNQISLNLLSIGAAGVTAEISNYRTEADGGTGPDDDQTIPFSTNPVTKNWTNVEIDLSLPSYQGSSSNTVTVKLDGQTVVTTQPLTVALQGGVPSVNLGIGAVDSTPSTPWAINYDNFTVTITPN
jgi:hypothetical protein